MRLNILKTAILFTLMMALTACSSSSDSDSDDSTALLDGELTVEVRSPSDEIFGMFIGTWDGESSTTENITFNIPEEVYVHEIAAERAEGVYITMGPVVEGTRLTLLSDGEVLAETTEPTEGEDDAEFYLIEYGSIPDTVPGLTR
jgi:hypothetical protein